MRVLSVVENLDIGGTQRVAKNTTALYREMGYESAILSLSENYSPIEWLDKYKIPFFFKLDEKPEAERKNTINSILGYAPDIVHIHNNGISKKDLSDWLPLLSPRPLVLETCHFPIISDYFEYIDIHLQLSHWCLWQFYCALRREKKDFHKKVYILPHVVDTSAFFPTHSAEKASIREKLGLGPEALVFGRIGQAYLDKWSWLIFDAFRDIAKENPYVYLLLIALPKEYKLYIKEFPYEVQKRIIIREATRDPVLLREYYQSMDFFLHAANQGETFGMVLAESMLSEIPVISLFTPYRDNSQLEITGFQKGAIIVSNKSSMKKAMELLMRDKKRSSELGRQGRRWVLEQYSSNSLGIQLQNIIEEALNKNKIHTLQGNHSLNRKSIKKEIKRQIKMVYDWKYVFHLPMLALLARTREALQGKIVYLYRFLLGHIPLRILWASLVKNLQKLCA